jgi:hypothetical protein
MTKMIPKYDKLELLVKNKVNNFELPTTTKIEFLNCDYKLHGNYLVVNEFASTELDNTETNRLFNLDEISAFRTYNYK